MPTKTRLDPKADGDGPSAEPPGAPGSSPGGNSTSAAAGPPAGVTGFIDALNAMSAHLKAREAMEARAQRGWGVRAALCGALLAAQGLVGALMLSLVRSYSTNAGADAEATTMVAVLAAAALTAGLALVLYSGLAARPLRRVPDSADRVALRHEDSPVRDRIRISQWILFDTVFTRFCIAEGTANARAAGGIAGVSLWATASMWVMLSAGWFVRVLPSEKPTIAAWNLTTIAALVVLALATMAVTDRRMLADRALAQHYARQVLAFDRDFGGFLPRVERERVEAAMNVRRARGEAPPADVE